MFKTKAQATPEMEFERKYELEHRTGAVRRSDGKRKRGFSLIRFPKVRWHKITTKYGHVKFKMRLPHELLGSSYGTGYSFGSRYIEM